MMRRPLLREENIVASLQAANCEDALRKLVDAIPTWRMDQATKAYILKLLILRERVGTTAIGQGIALPHCCSPDVTNPSIVFGVSRDGVLFSSLDGDPTHFIFVLILPQGEGAEQTKREILKNIKWSLSDRHLQERLRAASSASEVSDLLSSNAEPNSIFR